MKWRMRNFECSSVQKLQWNSRYKENYTKRDIKVILEKKKKKKDRTQNFDESLQNRKS